MPELSCRRAAMLCGSYVHGTPTENSDIDLLILVPAHEALLLGQLADPPNAPRPGWGSFPVKYGKLNLIVCYEEKTYDKWVEAISEIIAEAPCNKERAREICRSYGVSK